MPTDPIPGVPPWYNNRPESEGFVPPDLRPRPEEEHLLDTDKEPPQTESPGQPAGKLVHMGLDDEKIAKGEFVKVPAPLAKVRSAFLLARLGDVATNDIGPSDINEFQAWVMETPWSKSVDNRCDDLSLWVMGLGGEAGEVIEPLKKHIRDGTPINEELLTKELGDVLIVLSAIAAHFEISMTRVMAVSRRKIADRMARGTMRGAGDNR